MGPDGMEKVLVKLPILIRKWSNQWLWVKNEEEEEKKKKKKKRMKINRTHRFQDRDTQQALRGIDIAYNSIWRDVKVKRSLTLRQAFYFSSTFSQVMQEIGEVGVGVRS